MECARKTVNNNYALEVSVAGDAVSKTKLSDRISWLIHDKHHRFHHYDSDKEV